MYLLIPIWGITGAATAIAFAFHINNIMRYIFLYRKYGMQPFTKQFGFIFLSFFAAFFLSTILPELQLIWDILVRSTLFTIIYITAIISFKVSPEINETFSQLIEKSGLRR